MIEHTSSLLPHDFLKNTPQALCIGFNKNHLHEMQGLLDTLGIQMKVEMLTTVRLKNPATYLGSGKVEEALALAQEHKVQCIICDCELAPSQLKNLEKIWKIPILDRPGVIIEIFSAHARTKEAKTQVSLVRLQYLLPRLSHFWTHFERQRGGGSLSRGMGEKQLEIDKRLIKNRMLQLKKQLQSIEKERKVQRAQRANVLKVALVGYTNAGKSTLLNHLTQSHTLVANKLFATLDASCRVLDGSSSPPVVIIDTVGFIRNLPPSLIASFRSTLEELFEADLLVHVIDASHPQASDHRNATIDILDQLGLSDKPCMTILNKKDLLQNLAAVNLAKIIAPGCTMVACNDPTSIEKLRQDILRELQKNLQIYDILLPYDQPQLEARLHALGSIEHKKYFEKGMFLKIRLPTHWFERLKLEKYAL